MFASQYLIAKNRQAGTAFIMFLIRTIKASVLELI
jgi:hypothetical protein